MTLWRRVLRETRHAWRASDVIRSENTGMLSGSTKRPDVLVLEANVSPVVIEAEIVPALTVESDAISRLGEHVSTPAGSATRARRAPRSVSTASPSSVG